MFVKNQRREADRDFGIQGNLVNGKQQEVLKGLERYQENMLGSPRTDEFNLLIGLDSCEQLHKSGSLFFLLNLGDHLHTCSSGNIWTVLRFHCSQTFLHFLSLVWITSLQTSYGKQRRRRGLTTISCLTLMSSSWRTLSSTSTHLHHTDTDHKSFPSSHCCSVRDAAELSETRRHRGSDGL